MGIELCFAELKDPVKDKLKRFGLFAQLGEKIFFPTIGVAVSRYLKTADVDWVDWEDKAEEQVKCLTSSATRPLIHSPRLTAEGRWIKRTECGRTAPFETVP